MCGGTGYTDPQKEVEKGVNNQQRSAGFQRNGDRAPSGAEGSTKQERACMIDHHARAIDFIVGFLKNHGLEETIRRSRIFMISYLGLMRAPLPDVAKDALVVSTQFISGEADHAGLEVARNRCWNYLRSIDSRYDFGNRENLAIRAAWCTLITHPTTNELQQTIEYFLEFADRIEDHSSQIENLLQQHFG